MLFDSVRCEAFRRGLDDVISPESVVLDIGPSDPDTHWGRTIFPTGNFLSVTAGTPIGAHFIHEPCGKERSKASWEVHIGDYAFRSELVTVLTEEPE